MPNIIKPSGLNQIWAAGGTKVDPGVAKTNIGWVVELPPYQYQNWLDNRQDVFIAHTNQHGVPEWDSETEYQGNLSYTQGSDGIIYKCIQTNTNLDPVNPLNNLYWARAFETYGSVAVVQNALTAHLTNYATLSGISNPVAARNNLSVWSKTESDARFAFKAGDSAQTFSVGVATLAEHAVRLGQVTSLLTAATESAAGIIQIATSGEVSAGTNDTKAVTPLKLANQYLSKAGNLAGLANTAAARTNLGLGTAAVQNVSAFLQPANNLNDVSSVPAARANLGLTTTATQPEAYFLRSGQNLADLTDVSAARTNLGLTSTATTPVADFLLKADNLAGLTNVVTARNNLGLADSATLPSTTWMKGVNNLSDLTNTQTARNNLGLGGAATKNTFGFTGDFNYTNIKSTTGYTRLPNGIILQWGVGPSLNDDQSALITLPVGGVTILNVQVTGFGTPSPSVGPCLMTSSWTNSTFIISNNYGTQGYPTRWFAVTAV